MIVIDDLGEVTGIDPQMLRNWTADEVITPAVPGAKGRGKVHQFSIPQAVGLIVAEQYRKSPRGCALKFVRSTVQAFGRVTEEWLVGQIEAGDKYYLQPHHTGHPLCTHGGEEFDWPNIETALRKVKAKIRASGRR